MQPEQSFTTVVTTFLKRYFGQSRGSRVRLSVATGLFAKGFLLLSGLVVTPIVIRYLGREGYGLFATVTAVVSWLQITNFGVGAALQNSLTEAVAKADLPRQRSLVSTAFFFLLGITAFLTIAAIVSFRFVPWEKVFSATETRYARELSPAVAIVLCGFITTFLLTLVNAIYAAKQELHIPNLLAVINSIINIAAVFVVVHFNLGLVGVTAATVGPTVFVTWGFAFWYFLQPSRRPLRPSLATISREAWRRIFR